MIVIHISRERYDNIRKQGYQLHVDDANLQKYPKGDTEFHLLEGERGHCETCNAEFESVKANDPVELQYAKMAAQA